MKRLQNQLVQLNHTSHTVHACDWGLNRPQEWAPAFADLWRTSTDPRPDIFGNFAFSHITAAFEENAALDKYAQAGKYNDPGILLANAKNIKLEEFRAQFSLWCVMGAPLFIGNDVSGLSADELAILTNKPSIDIRNDASRQPQGTRYYTNGALDYVAKALKGNRAAIAAFNRGSKGAQYRIVLHDIAKFINLEDPERWKNTPEFECQNIWTGERVAVDALEGALYAHAAALWVCE